MRFGDILNNYFVEPSPGSPDGKPEPLGSLVPSKEEPDFSNILNTEGGGLDTERVFQTAGVIRDTSITAEKVLELIDRLPEDIPIANRRVVVRMTMETMGATARGVLEDAAAKLWALDCYFRAACKGAAEASQEIAERIKELQQQINELTETKKHHEARRAEIESSADSTTKGIQKVVEFFAVQVGKTAVESSAPAGQEPAAPTAQSGPVERYDPIRRPAPGAQTPPDDELELADPTENEEQPSGFWEASNEVESPDAPDERAISFYTQPDGTQVQLKRAA